VTTTGVDNTMRADAGFSPSLNFRVFQQYRRIATVGRTAGTGGIAGVQVPHHPPAWYPQLSRPACRNRLADIPHRRRYRQHIMRKKVTVDAGDFRSPSAQHIRFLTNLRIEMRSH